MEKELTPMKPVKTELLRPCWPCLLPSSERPSLFRAS